MEHSWLHKANNDRLLLFFNGWGQDASAIAHLQPGPADVLAFHAYHRGDNFDFATLSRYRQVDIVAWSMGVWYADTLGLDRLLPIGRTLALCGTPAAIDPQLGIPPEMFRATLDGLTPRTLEKFGYRTCGGVQAYRDSPLSRCGRTFEDIRAELAWWGEHYTPPQGKTLWQRALIGTQDGIFPPENQRRAWQAAGVPVFEKDLPHYPLSGVSGWDVDSLEYGPGPRSA